MLDNLNMSFGWPGLLVLLAVLPVLVAVYLLLLRRKKKYTVRYPSLALLRPALSKQSSLRRHLPAALYLLALASLLVAVARPTVRMNTPSLVKTFILVIDVSASMNDGDIAPSRLKAAEQAALSFIEHTDESTQVGIVIFSTNAALIVPPTTNRGQLKAAILNLTTGEGTAIGSSILTALQAIADGGPGRTAPGISGMQKRLLPYQPEIVILLTDGENNIGPQPLDAAQAAAEKGVRIYTIGIGAQYRFAVNNGNPSGPLIPDTGSFTMRQMQDATLKQIAAMTGGKYYTPETAAEMVKVFTSLTRIQVWSVGPQEISVAFSALGALLVCAAVFLSQSWHTLL